MRTVYDAAELCDHEGDFKELAAQVDVVLGAAAEYIAAAKAYGLAPDWGTADRLNKAYEKYSALREAL